jgi:CheY-like chemotaxis protein
VKVLIVDPDPHRAPGLAQALVTGGAEVTVAPNGSFALTMLEWNRHDVVISRALIDDMGGHELCAIVKADPSTREMRFVLVASADEVTGVESAAAGVDLVLPPTVTGSAIVPLVVKLMRGDRTPVVSPEPPRPVPIAAAPAPAPIAPTPAPAMTPPPSMPRPAKPAAAKPLAGVPSLLPVPAPPSTAEPPKRYATAAAANGPSTWKTTPVTAAAAAGATPGPDLLAVPSGMFQGSLEVMDLAELTQAIGQGGKSGRLILALGRGSGLIVFEAGRVVHAEFRSTVGEEAFTALLAASHGEGGGRFCFVPATGGTPAAKPRTIDKSVEQLLLSTATAIDEKG